MSFMYYRNSTTYFHRVCVQSGIVRKKLGFEARCYIIVIYLNVRGDQIGLFKLVTLNCILNRITGVTFGC
jgi:hypothetical protein